MPRKASSNTVTSVRSVNKAVKSATEDVIIEIHGLKIRENSLYEIANKLDKNAPSGLANLGASVWPGSQQAVSVRTVKLEGTNQVIYDTGFYVSSPCYQSLDMQVRKKIVSDLTEKIVKPFEQLTGREGILNHTNEDFWDDYMVKLYKGRVFNTNEPKDLLELYIAIRKGALEPVNAKNKSFFNHAKYYIKDKNEVVDYRKRRSSERFKAINQFSNLIADDNTRDLLVETLYYLKVISQSVVMEDDLDLQDAFDSWSSLTSENPERFLIATEKMLEPSGKKEIYTSNAVNYFLGKSIRKEGIDYWYENEKQLGRTPQEVIKRLVNAEGMSDEVQSKEYLDIREALLDRYYKRSL